MGGEKIKLSELNQFIGDLESDHVQVVAEKSFPTFTDAAHRYYIRGCSGFAGFAPGSSSIDGLKQFSSEPTLTYNR